MCIARARKKQTTTGMPIRNNPHLNRRIVAAVSVAALIAAGCGSKDSSEGRTRSLEAEIEALEARVQALEEQTGAEARYRDADANGLLDRAVVELNANRPFVNGSAYETLRTNLTISERRPDGITVPVIVVDHGERFCPPSPECIAVAGPPAARSPVTAAVAVWSPLGCRYAVYDPQNGWWVAKVATLAQSATICDPVAASADYAISPGRSGPRRGLDSIGLWWGSHAVGET